MQLPKDKKSTVPPLNIAGGGPASGNEQNEMMMEEKIKEYENALGDLIFECFDDEVNWI